VPRLTQQLFKSDYFIQVGDTHFQIPRNIFGAADRNLFTLGFADFFAAPVGLYPSGGDAIAAEVTATIEPTNVEDSDPAAPGMSAAGAEASTETASLLAPPPQALRPPALAPRTLPGRDPAIFADLLRMLQGYDVAVRDAVHRRALLRDARYFHFKGVEQRLLPCRVAFNLRRSRREITMRLEDLRVQGVGFAADPPVVAAPPGPLSPGGGPAGPSVAAAARTGYLTYRRPLIDDEAYELVLEVGGAGAPANGNGGNGSNTPPSSAAAAAAAAVAAAATGRDESTVLDPTAGRAIFAGPPRAAVTRLLTVAASKMGLPAASLPLGLMLVRSGGGVAAQPVSPATSGISGDRVRVRIGADAHVRLDGAEMVWRRGSGGGGGGEQVAAACASATAMHPPMFPPPAPVAQVAAAVVVEARDGVLPAVERPADEGAWRREWVVSRALWRVRIEPARESGRPEAVLYAVKVEAHTSERARNREMEFLPN
jgi:hypothetical protein